MKINKYLKKTITYVMLMTMIGGTILSIFPTEVLATEEKTKIERISNPNAKSKDADGLETPGNRETSYAWAMTTRGDYVYIGTNKNVVGGVADAFASSMESENLTKDQAWSLINYLTDNAIPRPSANAGGEIFKCNINTGEITKIYTADPGVAFRMAIEFDGDLYFGSYSSDITATNYIYKIDENDQITQDFVSEYGTSMRAACIHDEELYFGGVDSRYDLAEGYEEYAKIAIVKKASSNDEWRRVADYKDFGEYSNDAAVKNTTASPIWDICSYDGYIYATLPNTYGLVMFRGHEAEGNEPANEYGWYWEEVIGKNNSINHIGMAETAEGQIGANLGMVSACATPFVFKDKLYLMDFDNTIQAEVMLVTGALQAMAKQGTEEEPNLKPYLTPIYATLSHPQMLWVYDDATGKFNEVKGFSKFMKDTCNEYLWRAEVYNDELYITTMDSAIIYSWDLQFTGDHFTRLTIEEIDTAIEKINSLLSNEKFTSIANTLEQTKTMLTEYKTVMSDSKTFADFVVKYEDLFIELENFDETLEGIKEEGNEELNTNIADISDILSKFDIECLKMYAYIVRLVKNDVMGFDMLKTSDGVNFEIVTDDGFEDPYNYGGRSLITTPKGLYVGTSNPFYGAQLWRISNNKGEQKPEDPPKTEDPEDDKKPSDIEDGKKPEDDTTAPDTLPNTGKIGIFVALVSLLGIVFNSIKKYTKYKDI